MSATRWRTIVEDEEIAGHFVACFDELYSVLGAMAPRLDDDAIVVAIYEMARDFGDVRHRFESLLAHRAGVTPYGSVGSVSIIGQVLASAESAASDGSLVLYAISMVVGPRLLISLRDASEGAERASGGPLRRCCANAASVVVGAIRKIGEIAGPRGPVDDDVWRENARILDELVSAAGFAESFGLGVG